MGKRGKGINGDSISIDSGSANMDEGNEQEYMKKKQEKIDQRKEVLRKHLEDVKWQAVDKILNEKGRKERDKEKKKKQDIEDAKIKAAAVEERKRQALTNIHIKYSNNGQVLLSFPHGFFLPKVLDQKNGTSNHSTKTNIGKTVCMNCGKPSKYCNPKSKKYSCSIECFKLVC